MRQALRSSAFQKKFLDIDLYFSELEEIKLCILNPGTQEAVQNFSYNLILQDLRQIIVPLKTIHTTRWKTTRTWVFHQT